jgi:hypothetical protein
MSRSWWRSIGIVGMLTILVGCTSKAPVTSSSKSQATTSTSPIALPAPKEVWMNQFQQINGTPYLYAPIYVAEQEQRNIIKQIKSGSYENRKGYLGDADIRNYMFVHRDNLSANKLLVDNSSRLLELEQIGEPLPPAKSGAEPMQAQIKTVKTLWHVRVLADTNGDRVLNNLDRKQIAISDVSGANYTEIIKDIDKILLFQRKGLDRRLLIYTSGSKRFVANVDIPKRVANIKQLPAID